MEVGVLLKLADVGGPAVGEAGSDSTKEDVEGFLGWPTGGNVLADPLGGEVVDAVVVVELSVGAGHATVDVFAMHLGGFVGTRE